MKRHITFIPRLAIALAVAGSFALIGSLRAQSLFDEHQTTDNPHLRPKPKATEAAAEETKLSQKDQKFLSQVAASGAYEVADGKVAQQQGNAAVKNVASRIVADRTRSNQELMDLAKKKGVSLNTGKIAPRNMGKSNFDKQYVHTVTHDYDEDIALFQKQAQSGDDKDVKAWAAKTLPMLKQHHAMLKETKGSESAKPKE